MFDVSKGAISVPSYILLFTVTPKTVMPVIPKGLSVIFAKVVLWSVIT